MRPDAEPACLAPEVLSAYAAGRLSEEELAVVSDHIHECVACRRLASQAAELALSGVSPRVDESGTESDRAPAAGSERGVPRVLAPGTRISRYVVERWLGAGGMGVVYLATDPALKRSVALKVLHDQLVTTDLDAADLVRREAMAMARVAHPNVVGIYDLFREDDALYIVMELIQGATLTRWLAEADRSWEEIVAASRSAGAGLAAAHAEGIVHRDFKPDNVLVSSSGRVCVSDFGLSRVRSTADEDAPVETGAIEGTHTLPRAGTPRYMSPEQRKGETATAKSDQYSFSVTLYEALYKEHPFLTDARRPPPPRVPRWVRKVVLRGLETNPDARYPTMGELLRALDYRPRQTARRVLGVAVTLLVLAAVAVPLALRSRVAHTPSCLDVERSWAGIWDDSRKDEVHRAFAATGTPFAEAGWRTVDTALDRYVSSWVAMRVDVCEATRVRGTQSSELSDLRMECLDRRRREVGALTSALARADAEMARKAPQNLAGFAPLDGCADGAALRAVAPPPPDAAVRSRVDDVRAKVDESAGLRIAGKFVESYEKALEATTAAQAIGYRPALAEALNSRGHAQYLRGKYEEALQDSYATVAMADETRQDAIAANAWTRIMETLGARIGRVEQSFSLMPVAEAAVVRAGDPDLLRVQFLRSRANVELNAGKAKLAHDDFEAALARAPGAFGDSPIIGKIESALGLSLVRLGKYEEARSTYTSALTVMRAGWGEEHPDVAKVLVYLAEATSIMGRYDEARELAARSLATDERELSPDHPQTVEAETTLAAVLLEQHDYAAALPVQQRVLEAATRTNSPDMSQLELTLAEILLRLGRLKEAAAMLHDALAEVDAADTTSFARIATCSVAGRLLDAESIGPAGLGYAERGLKLADAPDLEEVGQKIAAVREYGEALARRRRYPEAMVPLERAAREAEASLGPRHPSVGIALVDLGMARTLAGDRTQGPADLARALDILKSSQLRDPRLVASVESALALAGAPATANTTRQLTSLAHDLFRTAPSSLN